MACPQLTATVWYFGDSSEMRSGDGGSSSKETVPSLPVGKVTSSASGEGSVPDVFPACTRNGTPAGVSEHSSRIRSLVRSARLMVGGQTRIVMATWAGST